MILISSSFYVRRILRKSAVVCVFSPIFLWPWNEVHGRRFLIGSDGPPFAALASLEKKRKKTEEKKKWTADRETQKKRSPIFFATHTKKKKKKKKGERWAEQIKKKEQQYPTDRRLKEAHNGLRSPIILLDIDSNLFEYSDNAAWNRSISIVNRRPNNNDVPFEPLFNIGFPISTTISVTDLFFD